MPGNLCFVLHAHMPYVKKHGTWPFGEEWVYEAMAETYLPLLNMLNSLIDEGVSPRITINISPVLLEQLADPYMKGRFEEYLKSRIELAEEDIKRLRRKKELQRLAEMYREMYEDIMRSYHKYNRDIPGAFKKLQDKGHVEMIACAATHAYLPLLLYDEWVYAQLKVGVETYKKFFSRPPRGIWLPEMGYRPGGKWKGVGGVEKEDRKGIDEILEELGIEYFFVDAHAIEGRQIRVIFSGGEEVEENPNWKKRGTTYKAYRVKGRKVYVLGRNMQTSLQVWSRDIGYPGDGWYREFHKTDHHSGFQYWRVTDQSIPLDGKKVYNPAKAKERVREHAEHFYGVVRGLLEHKPKGSVVLSPYDAELFGHWWFEGIEWLRLVIKRVSENGEVVKLSTVSEYLDEHPPKEEIELPESSWGYGGGHMTWWNERTEDMWKKEYEAEKKALELKVYSKYRNDKKKYILQALRELLLMQASDWEFLIFTEQAPDYGKERFNDHYRRFMEIYEAIRNDTEVKDNTMFSEDTLFDDEILEDVLQDL